MKFALSLAILASAAPAQAEFMKITLPSINFPEIQPRMLQEDVHADDHHDHHDNPRGPDCNTVDDCQDCDENGCEPKDFTFCAIPGKAPTRLRRSLFGGFYEGHCGDPVCMVAAPGFYDAMASGLFSASDASTQMREAGWCESGSTLEQWVSYGETNCDATNSDGAFADTLMAYKHLICDYDKACSLDIESIPTSPDKEFWCSTCRDPFMSILSSGGSTPEEVGNLSAMLSLMCTCNNDYISGGDPDWCAFDNEPQECKDALVPMFAGGMGLSDADFQGYLTTVTGMCTCSKQYMSAEDNYQVDYCGLQTETGECQDGVKNFFMFMMEQSQGEEALTPEDIESYWVMSQGMSLCVCYDFGGLKLQGEPEDGDTEILGWSLMSLCSEVSNACTADLKSQYINVLMMSDSSMTDEGAEGIFNYQFSSTCGYGFPEL
ncbi:hypothetical protein TL16_g10133 [Triparma laevis f. inornata]|uniref:Uncharacterized protein n=2 Tax=Triparma laevis TaxID=1534972 RepID=A0A9W7ACK3_9STRA|nr:hypothetical protein TrLO_g1605 [Triparma laevis f. longispina]GMH85131.1 hypothetical protein TL16_g10133 [Triparma laevis f. inornata]